MSPVMDECNGVRFAVTCVLPCKASGMLLRDVMQDFLQLTEPRWYGESSAQIEVLDDGGTKIIHPLGEALIVYKSDVITVVAFKPRMWVTRLLPAVEAADSISMGLF